MDTAVAKTPAAHMAPAVLEYIPLATIAPSPTNPRKHFDKAGLAELAESIKVQGIIVPLLLRPLPEKGALGVKYELVAGERRWRAAKIAGLAHAPAIVRNHTDVEVLELQLTENLQRADLDPIEEADGYAQLMRLKKINADQLAELIGKSRSYVYTRTKLNDLCPEARKALEDGKLDASRALLIARIGHNDTQRQALKDILGGPYGREPMSYREAREQIQRHYMLKLSEAPFDPKDEALVPKAGSCTQCPKRTGNQPDLFGDVKSADVCTDPKCFDDKRQAHFAGARKTLEAQGHKVIAGDAAKKIVLRWDSDHGNDHLQGGYVALDSTTYATGRSRKVSELLPPDYKPVLIQHPRTGKIIKAATQQAIAAVSQQARGSRTSSGRAAAKAKPGAPDIDDVLLERLVGLIHKNAPKEFGKAQYLALARRTLDKVNTRSHGSEAIAKAWGWSKAGFGGYGHYSRKLPKEAAALGVRDLVLFIFDLLFVDAYGTERKPILDLFDIDEAKVREQIIEERREARTATKKPAAKASAKPAAKNGKKK